MVYVCIKPRGRGRQHPAVTLLFSQLSPLLQVFPQLNKGVTVFKRLGDQICPCRIIGQGQPGVIIYINLLSSSTRCCIPSFKIIQFPVLEKKVFEGFYHILAWRPSWSFDRDHLFSSSQGISY